MARATLPASITTSFQGTAQAFQASLKGLGILLLMAILVIYLVLGILYELITLYLTPVVYVTLDRLQSSVRKRKGAESAAGPSNSA